VDKPYRQIRASYTDKTITVYQAYPVEIARPALRAGRFVPPFKIARMTWIKPSFLWMMYRCGWGRKPGQEHIFAIEITREGFEWALSRSSLSHFEAGTYATEQEWELRKNESPVRIQWDPERTLALGEKNYRSIQIGLSGESVTKYVNEWIVKLTDITPLAHEIEALVQANKSDEAEARLPIEKPYTISKELERIIGATGM
jgi:hypothetical protein